MAEEEVQPRDPGYDGMFAELSLDPTMFDVAGGEGEGGGAIERWSAADTRFHLTMRIYGQIKESGRYDEMNNAERRAMKDEAEHLATEIVKWMPEGALYEKVVRNLDVRPFLQQWAVEFPEGTRGYDVATAALEVEKEETLAQLRATNENNPVASRVPDEQLVASAAGYDKIGSVVGMRPTTVVSGAEQTLESAVAGGELTVEQANEALYSDDPLAALDDDPLATVTFPAADFERAMRIGEVSNIMELAQQDQDWIARQLDAGVAIDPSTSFTPIDLGMQVAPSPGVQGEMRPQATILNAVDAMDYLNNLRPAQVQNMQNSLARAGYMTNDQGLTFEPGDNKDELTNAAWQRALFEAKRAGVSLPKHLADRAATEETRRLEAAKLDDETMFRNGVNGMVREVLGRDMSMEEYTEVRNYITTLASERAMTVPGLDKQGWAGTTYDNEMFGENDIATVVQRVTEGEYGAGAGFNTMQAVRQAFDLGELDTKALAAWKAENKPRSMQEDN